MSLHTRAFSSLSHNKEGGYALFTLMIIVTAMLIGLAVALPSVYQEAQRDREEELIFRGNEYAHAIYLFQRQFRRYPSSVKELLQANNLRFLRRAYPDPMSPNGKWRFIHIGPNGALIDSLTQGPPQGASPFGPNPAGSPNPTSSPFGAAQTTSPQGETSANSSTDQNSSADQNAEQSKPKIPPGCSGKKSDSSSFFGDSDQPVGLAIAGVASCSHKESIRIYNKHTRYDEWEFLGTAFNQLGGAVPAQPVPGTQPGQPSPGQPNPNQPGLQPPQPQPPLTDQPVNQPPETPEFPQPVQPAEPQQ